MRHLILILCFIAPVLRGEDPSDKRGLNGLAEVEMSRLSDQAISPLGMAALAIHPQQWKHAETANFVYHFSRGFVATQVSVEAEFYYRVIARELERDTSQWERKSHIYIFEQPEDWRAFQSSAHLEQWTGGIHSGNDLFIVRNPQYKFKGRSLGHEVTHLVVHRFFGSGIPLWLNEGYAEFASIRAYASFMKARGYRFGTGEQPIAPADFIPLTKLMNLVSYPQSPHEVEVFYSESEQLVRYLATEDKPKFLAFFDALSKGNKTDAALWRTFGGRFATLDALEIEFKNRVVK